MVNLILSGSISLSSRHFDIPLRYLGFTWIQSMQYRRYQTVKTQRKIHSQRQLSLHGRITIITSLSRAIQITLCSPSGSFIPAASLSASDQ
jgi:hypothetical protein